MNLAELAHAGRTPSLPFTLSTDQADLTCQSLLRTLPNKRYVAKALWQGRVVLAKIFVGEKSHRHYQRELAGTSLLAQYGILTPKLLNQYQSPTGCWLLFDYLDHAITLEQQWQQLLTQPLLSTPQRHLLQKALHAIAILHQQGLWQQDLHLDNLLQYQEQLYWIDGDGIRTENAGTLLSNHHIEENLAIFFAQLPYQITQELPYFIEYYQKANAFASLDLSRIKQKIQAVTDWRVQDMLKKVKRDCTLFKISNTMNGFEGVLRTEETTLKPLLNNPDLYINQGKVIKEYGTNSVSSCLINGKKVLLKRYNIKSFKHRLSRFWRPTRGWHSWQEGYRLIMLGIATAKPLALIEERHFGMRGRAWLITDYLEGEDLLTHLKPYENTQPPEQELNALDDLFAAMIRNKISHGDFKGNNIFWVNHQWALIDLDAMQQHRSLTTFKRAYRKDRARFLRNWPTTSAIYQLLDQRLPTEESICDH